MTLPAGAPLPERFARYIAAVRGDTSLQRYPDLRAIPFHDPARFATALALEQSAQTIVAQCLALGSDVFHPESEPIVRHGSWDVFMFYERGVRRDENCARVPALADVLDSQPCVRNAAGLAYLSRLTAGTSLAPHVGPTNMRVRCHLGIDVPPGCGLRVGGIEAGWQRGKCLVFDDSLEHEAWNGGTRDRIVLVVDLWHPDLSADEIALIDGLQRWAARQSAGLAAYLRRNEAARGEHP